MIAPAAQLPLEIERYVGGFVRRRRVQRLSRAAARAVLFTIVWALLWCVADRAVGLAPAARMAALIANGVFVVAILGRPMLAMFRAFDPDAAAAEVERRRPALKQRLRTVTSRRLGATAYGGSREMLDALAREVADDLRGRDPAELVSWRPVARPAVACAAWVVFVAVLCLSPWLDLPRLARRYVAPYSGVRPVTTTRLAVTPGDAEIPQGESLRVRAAIERLNDPSRSPTLHVRAAGQPWHEQPLTPLAGGRFEGALEPIDRDVEYYVRGGDARSDVFTVRVLPRPAVTRFRIRYTYPPHTGLPPREVENETGAIEAPAGTDVRLAVETTLPLRYALMTIGAESIRVVPTRTTPAAAPRGGDGMTAAAASSSSSSAAAGAPAAEASFTVQQDRRYTLRMESERGVSGAFRGGTVRAIADRAPAARFRGAGGGASPAAAGAGDVIPLAYQVVDDYGVARVDAEVRVRRPSGSERSTSLKVDAGAAANGSRERHGVYRLALAGLGLEAGDEVDVCLRAEDRAGQFALSAPVRLTIVAPAAGLGPERAPLPAPAAERPPPPLPPPSRPARDAPDVPPVEPAGYAEAIRAYFDAIGRGRPAPSSRPASP